MTSALSLADQGFEVHLVEKEKELGGMARRIRTTLEGLDVRAWLKELGGRVYRHRLIHVYHEATITSVSGYVGSFVTTVEWEGGRTSAIDHGAAILATGAAEHRPAEYQYGEDDRVLTQLELEERIHGGGSGSVAAHGNSSAEPDEESAAARNDGAATATTGREWLGTAGSVVMIQCVGCRQEGRDYCARICCSQAVKNALTIKAQSPETDVYILYRDMRTYGFKEDYYLEAAEKGVRFVRWEPEAGGPVVEPAKGETGQPVLRVTVPDPVLEAQLAIDAGLVVLSAAAEPSPGSAEAARLFKTAQNPDGFGLEAHVKLRPVDYAADGVFLCGANHYPKHLSEAITQAYGAAGRAVTLLSQETVTASGAVCEVKENDCVSCGACITACTYGAVGWRETPSGRKAEVNPVLCKGDGLCCSKCPTDAIVLKHFTNDEIFSQIDAALSAPLRGAETTQAGT